MECSDVTLFYHDYIYLSRLLSPLRVPDDFPDMTVGVLKITGVATPKRVLGWFYDDRTGVLGLSHDPIDNSSSMDQGL